MGRIGRITEITRHMDGSFELTAEFGAGETFWSSELKSKTNKEFLTKLEFDLNKCHGISSLVWGISEYDIRKIYYNDKKKTTVVVWMDDSKTKVKMAEGDHCYIVNAVSAAVMKRKYGSNSAFKAHVEKMLGGYNDSAYQVLARAESSEIYGGYEELFMLIADKLILQ